MTLKQLQRASAEYFLELANPANGLVPDSTRPSAPSSIAAVGLGLGALVVAAEHGWMRRPDAATRALAALRFFGAAAHGPEPDATGYRGFYYHFLDMRTGQRAWRSELSTMDTALLLAGGLSAGRYFDLDTPTEREIRIRAEELYRRADWRWALDGGLLVSHGWRPGRGFIRHRWDGYSEALLLCVLGLGSPTHPLPAESYSAWSASYRWKQLYGIGHLYAPSLMEHQLPQLWIDFRGVRDAFMRERGIDYAENTRRATLVIREYARRNPRGWVGYGEDRWGFSASEGPGPSSVPSCAGGIRRFAGYHGRGVPWGIDDGTIAPWAAVCSLPFAPEAAEPVVAGMLAEPALERRFGLAAAFNPSFPGGPLGWVSDVQLGLEAGASVLALENHATSWFWELLRGCEDVRRGLLRAGFLGGWLGEENGSALSGHAAGKAQASSG